MTEKNYLRVPDASAYTGVPEATLNTLRSRGGGPPFIKRGSRVLYRRSDLDQWLLAGLRTSTSIPESKPVSAKLIGRLKKYYPAAQPK